MKNSQTKEYGAYVSPVLNLLYARIEEGFAISAGGATDGVTEEEGGSYDSAI